MEFGSDYKVIPETLTKEQAPVYILFLESEIKRHWVDIKETAKLIVRVKEKFNIK